MSRVGFDLDGVVYDFRAAHAEFEVARGNDHCALDKAADHWDYFEGWGLTLDEWLASYAEGVDAGHILWLGDALPGAVEVSKRLRNAGHTIHIVTDRSIGKEPQEATRSWLASVGFEYDTLDFNRDKTVVPTDIFIEDRLENADALNEAGTLCYLINRPWNLRDDYRPRVASLDEFFDRVQEVSYRAPTSEDAGADLLTAYYQRGVRDGARARAEEIAQAIESTDPNASYVHRAAYSRAARIARGGLR